MSAATVTRFAPSPTGSLHLGSAHAALVAWRRARDAGGRFLVRIEDIDAGRCRPEYEAAILEDLAWLGLEWEQPVRRQSAHMGEYRAALERLEGMGVLYRCTCSRADIAAAGSAPHGPEGALYPGTCRRRGAEPGKPYALRLDTAAALALTGALSWEEEGVGRVACDPLAFGDPVLGRKDVPASYHLCVTHDDAVQGVTLVTRGEDLRAATSVHRLIQALMGWPAPRYAHHRLILAADGRRLAKRDEAASIGAMRARGMSADAVRRAAAGEEAASPAPAPPL